MAPPHSIRGIYPTSYTDGLGRTTDVRYDERFGKQAVSSDPNEIVETWTYDDSVSCAITPGRVDRKRSATTRING